MSATDERSEIASNLALVGVFGLIAALAAIDLVLDLRSGSSAHALTETALAIVGIGAATVYALRVRRLAREAKELREQTEALAARLDVSQADAARWRRDASALITGLGEAIDQQLERWGLSAAEKEIALLLLKGLSHKEIAELRAVVETTVRQQARAIYRKAGLSGRNDLAAFFLEDLLGPHGARVSPS